MKGIFHPSDTSHIDGDRQEFLRPNFHEDERFVYRLEGSASGKILSFRRCVGRDGRSVGRWLKHRGTTRMVRGETWSLCAKLLVAAVSNDGYFSMSEDHAIPIVPVAECTRARKAGEEREGIKQP